MKSSLRLYRTYPPDSQRTPCALTIGNFDGVHRGHQAILARLCQAALEQKLTPSVMTFAPHPREYFALKACRPELIPTRISGLRDKLSALACHGIQQLVIERFDQRLAGLSAQDFVRQLLVQGLRTRWLMVGEDFRFGHQRSGDIETLRQAGRHHGFTVVTLADVTDSAGHRISSSEVRSALAFGDMPRAADLLGRHYAISGHVIHGRKLGRTLGFPTLNLHVPPRCAARSGIYAVRVLGLGDTPLPGVASLGVRPTVDDSGRILLEVHLLDAAIDAYGKLVRIEFLHRLRDEEKFPDFPTLTAAIAQDERDARAYFSVHGL